MTRLYLDVETYREKEPFEEKIIAIGVIEDWTPRNEKSLNEKFGTKSLKFETFSEWELESEELVIKKFYKYFENILQKSKYLEVVGFGILRFDIPLLKQKGVEYEVKSFTNLNKLWYKAYVIDLFQCSLPINSMLFKGNKLEDLADKSRNIGLKISELYGEGSKVKEWYEKGEYRKITKHLKLDLKVIRELDLTCSIVKLMSS